MVKLAIAGFTLIEQALLPFTSKMTASPELGKQLHVAPPELFDQLAPVFQLELAPVPIQYLFAAKELIVVPNKNSTNRSDVDFIYFFIKNIFVGVLLNGLLFY